jgi:hypothetical protein
VATNLSVHSRKFGNELGVHSYHPKDIKFLK